MADSQGQTVGPWTLGKRLGWGGNATVWEAVRSAAEQPVALKLIKVNKVDKEPYQRFVREIEFLREHQSVPGLLPLLDANLPDQPSNTDRPWLTMPIATPISDALADRPLPDIVKAVAAITDTLTRLQRDFNIAHRDIKPGNLYELDGSWLIGDFGLIALPDADTLTKDGRQVGPAHYTAYEMILHPSTADPHPADVYSLGKTLWVLATGQAWPPEGHQPVGTQGFEIGDFRPHPRAAILDQEVDLMTRLHSEERPSKEQVARDLASWQALATEPATFDVSDARARLHEKLKSTISEQDMQAQYQDLARATVRRLQELTAPLNEGLKSIYSRTKIDSSTDDRTRNVLLRNYRFGYAPIFQWQRCTVMAPFERSMAVSLRMGRALQLYGDGTITLALMIDVGPEMTMGNYFNWLPTPRSAPVGSAEAEQMLEQATRELADALREGIAAFEEHLPEDTDG